MEIFLIFVATIILTVLYFCFGALVSFIWGWWISIVAILTTIYILYVDGWNGVTAGIFLIAFSIIFTDSWQGTNLYNIVSDKIDSAFNFNDV